MPRRPDDDPREDGFFSRWSRRKRSEDANAAEAEAEAPPVSDQSSDAAPPPEPAADPRRAPITPEDLAALPKVEDLVPGADIRGFLRPGVPAALKNAALRRMWLLTPAIRDHADPAVDYAWDWNTPGGVPGDGLAATPERAAEMLRALREVPRKASAPEVEAGQDDALPDATPVNARPQVESRPEPHPERHEPAPAPEPTPKIAPTPSGASVPGTNPAGDKGSSAGVRGPDRARHGGARPT